MRRLILATATLATLVAPLAAQAYPGEIRDDRREIRQEARDLNRAQLNGDRGDIREQREDLRDARREYREDIRDRRDDRGYRGDRDGYRGDRDGYRGGRDGFRGERYGDGRGEWRAERRYSAGRYYYPRGNSYRAWAVGGYIPRAYWGERYWIRPASYGLPFAARGTRWVRVGPDALLIRTYNGAVVRVVRGMFY